MPDWRLEWAWAGHSGTARDIDPQWIQRSALYSDDAGTRTVTVRWDPGIDVAELVAAGHHPMSGWGTLYAGDRVIVSGPWRRPSYGQAGELLEVQIAETDSDDRSLIPREGSVFGFPTQESYDARLARFLEPYQSFSALAKRVLTSTFDLSSRKAKGAIYPMVWGAPGSSTTPGSPGMLVDSVTVPRRLMIAGHRVQASTVTIWGPEYGTTSSSKQGNGLVSQSARPVLHDVDARGNEYAYVTFDTVLVVDTGQIAPYPDARFWVSWTGGDALDGGAGDVLLSLYAASTLRVDVGAWSAMRAVLNRWTLAGYISELVSPAEVARRAILPVLPMQVVLGDGGLEPVLWPWLDVASPRFALVAGPGLSRGGRVTYSDRDPVAEITVKYRFDPESDDYSDAVAVSAGSTPYGRVSAGLFGSLARGSDVDASWLWDTATAQDIAAAQLVSRAVPRRQVRYQCDPSIYGLGGSLELRPGLVVTLSDEAIGLNRAVAVVAEVEQTPVEMSVVIELRDDPLTG